MKTLWIRHAAALALLATVGTAHAYITRLGEDLQKSASTPLTTLPNSTAAQTQFLSALNGVGVENFENQPAGTPVGGQLTLQFPSAAGTSGLSATLAGGGSVGTNPVGGTDGNGRFSIGGGTKFWLADAANQSFTVTFNKAIAAFGFFGSDIGDFGGELFLDLYDDGGSLLQSLSVGNTVGQNQNTDGSVLFFGLIASDTTELFRSITFRMTGIDSDYFGFDNFTIGEQAQVGGPTPNPTPEPGSLALVGAALLAAALGRRRSKR